MNRPLVLGLLALALCGCESMNGSSGRGGGDAAASADAGDQQHRIITPKDLKWEAAPASLPPGAQVVKLEGDPAKPGYFAMRVRFPEGYRIQPHWHPNYERVTVLSGMFHLGHGETFDPSAAQALPPGTYVSMPPGMRHFAFVKGVTDIQVTTLGPWAVNYVNPADDPRQAGETSRGLGK